MLPETVVSYLNEHSEQFVAELQRLCRQPSVSAQNLGLGECAELVKTMMEQVGLHTQLFELEAGPPVVYGELQGRSDKTLIFYDHYDVQPPEPLELWQSDPWAAEIRDGVLYARGASDNKSNIVSRLKAMEAWLQTAGQLPCSVKWVIEGEEETGSRHLGQFIRAERARLAGDGCIWEFGGLDDDDIPAIVLGLKGMLYVELTARGPAADLHSARAAIVENPAWRLVQALSTIRDAAGHVTIEGWYERVRDFTPAELAALEAVPLPEEELKRELGIAHFLNDMHGPELKKALAGGPTANIAGIWGGYRGEGHKTVLPAQAQAKLDFRLVPDQEPEELAERLRSHLQRHGFGDLELQIQAASPAARTPLEAEIVRMAQETARQVFAKEPIVQVSSAGSGPMALFSDLLKLPTVAIGCNHSGSQTHSPNENQRLDVFLAGTQWMAAMLERFGQAG
ncbi:MAG TPA: M20/M25/M40 family metallo-hydrolase [Candidatus Fraserbacteria bacterium]|nr:M20/M25/M40 family metallo-hydrolase [Candidatus Fraserbacteria bacterium]